MQAAFLEPYAVGHVRLTSLLLPQKLVRKNSPPNIKFFPMTTRRMAWLLAAVVEPHDATHVHPTAAGGGDGGGNTMQNEHAEQEMVVVEDSLERTTAADSADSYERVAGGEALAKKLATRKRAASFLHQLLITVRLRPGETIELLVQTSNIAQNVYPHKPVQEKDLGRSGSGPVYVCFASVSDWAPQFVATESLIEYPSCCSVCTLFSPHTLLWSLSRPWAGSSGSI